MRIIGAADLRRLVPIADAVELMKQVFAQHSRGETISPVRLGVELPDGAGVSLFMPAWVGASDDTPASLGAKIVSVFGNNPSLGLPTITAVVFVLDPATGMPQGLIEGASVTALRTGAVSGAATDLLARKDASVLTVFGAGAQGVTQAAAVCAVRDIQEIRVIDPVPAARESFADRMKIWMENPPAVNLSLDSAQDALRGADVVCTATTSTTAVFEDSWLEDGTHINGVGAFTPAMQEVPDETVARARIIVDAVEAIMHEAGDIVQPIERGVISTDKIKVELGHLVDGSGEGRQNDSEITFFKSVGNAIQDMVVARRAMDQAEAGNIGQVVSLD